MIKKRAVERSSSARGDPCLLKSPPPACSCIRPVSLCRMQMGPSPDGTLSDAGEADMVHLELEVQRPEASCPVPCLHTFLHGSCYHSPVHWFLNPALLGKPFLDSRVQIEFPWPGEWQGVGGKLPVLALSLGQSPQESGSQSCALAAPPTRFLWPLGLPVAPSDLFSLPPACTKPGPISPEPASRAPM